MADDQFLNGYLAGQNENNGGGFGWGGQGLWAVIILAIIFGWGGNGFGGFGGFGGGGGVQDGYVLASDMSRIQATITQGLCDGFYSTAQQINGVNMQNATNTAAIQQTLTQGFSGLNTGMVTQGYESRLATQAVQNQLASCCCDLGSQIANLNYNMAQNTNGTLVAIDKLGDRIDNRLRDMEFARLSEKLDEQRTQNAVLQGQIDRAQLRTDIVNDVRPCPSPAYITCNPWAYQAPGCGCA